MLVSMWLLLHKWCYVTYNWKRVITLSSEVSIPRQCKNKVHLESLSLYFIIYTFSYWCLAGNGWDWGLLG